MRILNKAHTPRKHGSTVTVAVDQLTSDQYQKPQKTRDDCRIVNHKETHSQVGILFVDGIQFWEGLGEGDGVINTP